MTDRKATSIRLSAEADRHIGDISSILGISRSAVIAAAISTLHAQFEVPRLREALTEERAIRIKEHWSDAPVTDEQIRDIARDQLRDEGLPL